jgi:hypothetical protein
MPLGAKTSVPRPAGTAAGRGDSRARDRHQRGRFPRPLQEAAGQPAPSAPAPTPVDLGRHTGAHVFALVPLQVDGRLVGGLEEQVPVTGPHRGSGDRGGRLERCSHGGSQTDWKIQAQRADWQLLDDRVASPGGVGQACLPPFGWRLRVGELQHQTSEANLEAWQEVQVSVRGGPPGLASRPPASRAGLASAGRPRTPPMRPPCRVRRTLGRPSPRPAGTPGAADCGPHGRRG